MSLDLHKLHHLIAVAEHGSITRAAQRLHLSQQKSSRKAATIFVSVRSQSSSVVRAA